MQLRSSENGQRRSPCSTCASLTENSSPNARSCRTFVSYHAPIASPRLTPLYCARCKAVLCQGTSCTFHRTSRFPCFLSCAVSSQNNNFRPPSSFTGFATNKGCTRRKLSYHVGSMGQTVPAGVVNALLMGYAQGQRRAFHQSQVPTTTPPHAPRCTSVRFCATGRFIWVA